MKKKLKAPKRRKSPHNNYNIIVPEAPHVLLYEGVMVETAYGCLNVYKETWKGCSKTTTYPNNITVDIFAPGQWTRVNKIDV